MKAILVAVVLAGCAFAFAIGTASADNGGAATATPSQSAPAAQPVQQNEQRPRDDCPEKDGDGSSSRQLGLRAAVLSPDRARRAGGASWELTSCQ